MKNVLLVAAIALATACGSSSKLLSSEAAQGTDFSRYKTYSFAEVQASGDTIPARYNASIASIKNEISKQMNARGFTPVGSNGDLYINLGIVVKETAQTRETDWRTDGRMTYMGQRNYSWQSQDVVVGYYRQGTLDMHLVDAASRAMVWKGTVTDVVPEKEKNMAEAVESAIATLFKKFPVAAK
jgi:hypothetical protein